jgi:hypothetical protein
MYSMGESGSQGGGNLELMTEKKRELKMEKNGRAKKNRQSIHKL